MRRECKTSHTGFWEYLIAISFKNEGKNTFTVEEMASKLRELESNCLLPHVAEATIIEQLTCRCCAQGSTEFGSLLNYFNREGVGLYNLFNPKTHIAIPERANISCVPTKRIIKHINERHQAELRCVLNYLNLDGVVHLIPEKPIKELRGFVKGVTTDKLRHEEDRF